MSTQTLTSERTIDVSFVLIAYNQESLIEEAIRGAFSQEYAPLEIILSDDCSTDRTFAIMQQMAERYDGPHKVILNRSKQNRGLVGHINDVMNLVRGELIVIAAGDDVSLPHRTRTLVRAFLDAGEQAMSLFSNAWMIDSRGNSLGLLLRNSLPTEISAEFIARRMELMTGATHAWHRAIFDQFGPLDEAARAEDMMLPLRSAMLGKVMFINEPLIHYRVNVRLPGKEGVQHKDWNAVFQKRLASWLIPHKRILQQRLDDIGTMILIQPERESRWHELKRTTDALMHSNRAKEEFATSHIPVRVWIFVRYALTLSENRRDFVSWALRFQYPSIYRLQTRIYYWLRRKAGTLY